MQKGISIILVIISLFLYFFAPMAYSWTYCAVCAVVYGVNAVMGFAPGFRKEPISFSLFFSLTVFICSFVFPLIIYPIDNSYSLFQFGYNHDVITKCTALVTLAHSVYWYGVTMAGTRCYNNFIVERLDVNDGMINSLTKLVVILFVAFLFLGGLEFYTDRYLHGNMSTNIAFQYLNVLFSTFAVTLSCMMLFAEKTSIYIKSFFVLSIISVIILSTGSRTLPMYLILPLAYVYQKRYNVSLLKLGMIGFVVLFAFVAIGHLRHEVITASALSSYDIKSSEMGYWDNLIDFIVCNRNLYDIYSYVDSDGILWGKNFLGSILSVVPFAQGIVSSVFGIPTYQLDSAYFSTYQVFGSQASLGLGTHVVGDVYLATGLLGVVVLFYLLGYFITKLRNGALALGNHFMYISYLYMLSYSVFFCRGSFFGAVKGILWSAIALYLLNKYYNKK